MSNAIQRYRNYQKLREGYLTKMTVPICKGTDMNVLRATMQSIDMTEDAMRHFAYQEAKLRDLPMREAYYEKVRMVNEERSRMSVLAVVNERTRKMWAEYKKKFSLSHELKALIP